MKLAAKKAELLTTTGLTAALRSTFHVATEVCFSITQIALLWIVGIDPWEN